jgi:hypothetical protein
MARMIDIFSTEEVSAALLDAADTIKAARVLLDAKLEILGLK